jgi:hypothetical protein
MTAQASFGTDSLELTDQLTVQNMEVGLVTTEAYAPMGFLGLGSSPFTGEDTNGNKEDYPSMITFLKNKKFIGSQCWGYTAGASYSKLKHSNILSTRTYLVFPRIFLHGIVVEEYDLDTEQANRKN